MLDHTGVLNRIVQRIHHEYSGAAQEESKTQRRREIQRYIRLAGLIGIKSLVHNRNGVRFEALKNSGFFQPFQQIFIQQAAIICFLTGDDVANGFIVQGIRLNLLLCCNFSARLSRSDRQPDNRFLPVPRYGLFLAGWSARGVDIGLDLPILG